MTNSPSSTPKSDIKPCPSAHSEAALAGRYTIPDGNGGARETRPRPAKVGSKK